MATVTGLTANRMLEIESASIIDGEIVGDDLVLQTRGGTTINAGNVRGATGPVGDMVFPISVPLPCFGTTAPTGYYLLDGGVYDPVVCPGLWELFGIIYGGTIESPLLPDLRGKTIFGYDANSQTLNTLGGFSGTQDVILTTSELPEHTHTQEPHTHTQNAHTHTQEPHTHTQNAHTHTQNAHNHNTRTWGHRISGTLGVGNAFTRHTADSASYIYDIESTSTTATNQNTTATNQNTTATNQDTTPINNPTGDGQPFDIIPPNIALNWIIRAA